MHVERSPGETEAAPDLSWRDLYRAGGISAVLFVVLVLVAIVIVVVAPPPLSADGATTLQYIASQKVLYIIEQVLWLAPSVFAAVVFLTDNRWGAPVLVYLSDHYMTAATAAQHTAFATAAEVFIAENNITSAAGILDPVVMLKDVFPKGVAYLGIVTGALRIISEALRPLIGPGYFVYGLLLPIWFLVVGWKLYWLARD